MEYKDGTEMTEEDKLRFQQLSEKITKYEGIQYRLKHYAREEDHNNIYAVHYKNDIDFLLREIHELQELDRSNAAMLHEINVQLSASIARIGSINCKQE